MKHLKPFHNECVLMLVLAILVGYSQNVLRTYLAHFADRDCGLYYTRLQNTYPKLR